MYVKTHSIMESGESGFQPAFAAAAAPAEAAPADGDDENEKEQEEGAKEQVGSKCLMLCQTLQL